MAVIVIAVVTMSMTANAQEKGDMAVGANVVFSSGDSYSNIGISAKFQYNILNPIRLEGSFTYFLKKNYISMWDASVNAHYLFPLTDKITLYPLAGVGILGSKVNFSEETAMRDGVSASSSEFGANIGGGIDFKLTDKFILNGEAKYKIGSTWNRLLLSAGVAYRF